ncbi:MAG: MarR family transcriptional regulator [Alphaproteobacteria bacterium]|nr:MarR family transcriptional regulator [Rhodospirillales bacterium]MCW9045162.1 MarR family transcriptional regulator [Alphaproteobacteria bacterium]
MKKNTDKAPITVPYLPSMGRLLGFASKGTNDISEKRLKDSDLTLVQWVLLTALWRKDGLTVGEVAKYYKSTEASTSNLIERMVKKGLLDRRHDQIDRRQVRVFLTEKSKSLSHLINFYLEINEVLLKGFNEEEKDLLSSMLERVIENTQEDLAKG